jgi:hypothetical protein
MEKAGQTAKIIWPVAACAGNAQLADKMPLIFRSFSPKPATSGAFSGKVVTGFPSENATTR